MTACPCGSQTPYEDCCQPLHLGLMHADAPATLMRSRYCAFVKGEAQYLLDTHAPEHRKDLTLESLEQACRETQWVNLELLDTSTASGDQGYVTFRAWYRIPGNGLDCLQERSRFTAREGRWYYCDGEFQRHQLGRNDPCPCGSGKKYKKCCDQG